MATGVSRRRHSCSFALDTQTHLLSPSNFSHCRGLSQQTCLGEKGALWWLRISEADKGSDPLSERKQQARSFGPLARHRTPGTEEAGVRAQGLKLTYSSPFPNRPQSGASPWLLALGLGVGDPCVRRRSGYKRKETFYQRPEFPGVTKRWHHPLEGGAWLSLHREKWMVPSPWGQERGGVRGLKHRGQNWVSISTAKEPTAPGGRSH